MNEVDSYYNIQMNFVIDLEELSLSNFVVNPPWMQSWENAYNVLYESLYKVNLDNIVAYPLSVASTSASKTLMVFTRYDKVILDTTQGKNDLNEVNVALDGGNVVGGGVKIITYDILPRTNSLTGITVILSLVYNYGNIHIQRWRWNEGIFKPFQNKQTNKNNEKSNITIRLQYTIADI